MGVGLDGLGFERVEVWIGLGLDGFGFGFGSPYGFPKDSFGIS
jgi:hypothetical protein